MNKIIILVFVFAGLAGVGILGNTFLIDIQPLGLFASLDELPGSSCSCADSEGNFSPDNCQGFVGDYTDSPEMVCEELAMALPNGGMEIYGDPPLETQGCNSDFWLTNESDPASSSVWPPGYSPNYYFNEMFQVSIAIPDQEDNKVLDEKAETSSTLEAVDETVNDTSVSEEITLESLENTTSSDPETVEEVVTSLAENNENSNSNNGLNLAGALELQGTKLNDLLRESVAAMLNAAHSEINYPYTVAKIITLTQIALANENYEELLLVLKEANNRGNTPICHT